MELVLFWCSSKRLFSTSSTICQDLKENILEVWSEKISATIPVFEEALTALLTTQMANNFTKVQMSWKVRFHEIWSFIPIWQPTNFKKKKLAINSNHWWHPSKSSSSRRLECNQNSIDHKTKVLPRWHDRQQLLTLMFDCIPEILFQDVSYHIIPILYLNSVKDPL